MSHRIRNVNINNNRRLSIALAGNPGGVTSSNQADDNDTGRGNSSNRPSSASGRRSSSSRRHSSSSHHRGDSSSSRRHGSSSRQRRGSTGAPEASYAAATRSAPSLVIYDDAIFVASCHDENKNLIFRDFCVTAFVVRDETGDPPFILLKRRSKEFKVFISNDAKAEYKRVEKRVVVTVNHGIYKGRTMEGPHTWEIKPAKEQHGFLYLDAFYGQVAIPIVRIATQKLKFVKQDVPDLVEKVQGALERLFHNCCEERFHWDRQALAKEYTEKIGVVGGLASILDSFEAESVGYEYNLKPKTSLEYYHRRCQHENPEYDLKPRMRSATKVRLVKMIFKAYLLNNGYPEN